jgi:hypothetical protein
MNRAPQRQLDQRREFLYGSIILFVLQSEGISTSEFAKLPKTSRTIYVACCGLIGLAVIIDLWVLFVRQRYALRCLSLRFSIVSVAMKNDGNFKLINCLFKTARTEKWINLGEILLPLSPE